jgi:hypothetical protein
MNFTKEELLMKSDLIVDGVYTSLLVLKNGRNIPLAATACNYLDCISSSRRLANRRGSEYFDVKIYYDYLITAKGWLESAEVEYASE